MFWESVALPSEITEDSTLEDILDDDYILQRCRERNTNLSEYLAKSDRISELIDLVTEQSNVVFDKTRFKRPSVAAEILSSDLPMLLDSLVSPRKLAVNSQDSESTVVAALPFIDHLLSFIETPMPLNSLSASFFSKIMTNLLLYRASVLMPYLRSQTSFFPNLLRHVETSAVCDLFIGLAQQDNGQQHVVPEWFLESNLIPQLLQGLSPNAPDERHEYSARCLIEFMSIYRNYIACNAPESMEDGSTDISLLENFDTTEEKTMFDGALAVLDELESEKMLCGLLDLICARPTHSASGITSCTDVFLACIEKAKSSNGLPPGAGDEFADNPFESLAVDLFPLSMPGGGRQSSNRLATKANCPLLQRRSRQCETNAASAAIPHLPSLYALLESSVPQNFTSMTTTVGFLSQPLGKGRLSIVNLISALCQLNNDKLRHAICKQGFLSCLMKLFEAYPYNSFLHKAVTDMFKQLLGPDALNKCEDGDKTPTNSDKASASDCDEPAPPAKNKPNVPESNVLIDHLMQDCHVIDWILRLSCIPPSEERSNAENEDPSSACRLSKSKPKPGYSGHLWQIANSITTRFPTTDSLPFEKQYDGLPADTAVRWDKFINGDLSAINEIQMAKIETEPEQRHEQNMNDILKLLRGPNLPDFRSLSGFRTTFSSNSSPIELISYNPVEGEDSDDPLRGRHHTPLASDWLTHAINFGCTDDVEEEEEAEEEDEGGVFHRRRLGDEEEDEDIVNVSSNSSSDEEDLDSPACIRQQRNAVCNDRLLISGASVRGQANGLLPLDADESLVKPANTFLQPWMKDSSDEKRVESPTATIETVGAAGTSDLSSGDDSGWANFESASFTQDAFQQEKSVDSETISPQTDSVKQC